tara:strand:+ start:24 stop:539 length:516 start_codon:yes stop_codon:yes gene_type:complete
MVKTCTKCKETQDLSNFGSRKNTKDGLTYWCKSCINSNWRKNSFKYKKKRKLYLRNYYEKNKELLLQNNKVYKSNNLPKWKDYHKEYDKKYMKQYTSGVYLVEAKNGSYVGQSHRIEWRCKYEHGNNNSPNSPVKNLKSFKILEVVEDKQLRLEREQYWINKLKPTLNALV